MLAWVCGYRHKRQDEARAHKVAGVVASLRAARVAIGGRHGCGRVLTVEQGTWLPERTAASMQSMLSGRGRKGRCRRPVRGQKVADWVLGRIRRNRSRVGAQRIQNAV